MQDTADLLGAITGYQRGAIVTAAWRTGVFDVLGTAPRPLDELADDIGAAGSGALGALLEALTGMGLAAHEPEGYRVASPVAELLRNDAAFGAVLDKEATFARLWLDLDTVVRDDAPLLAAWPQRLATEPARCRRFLEALDVLADLTGPGLERLPELAPDRAVVDLGGGLGSYARRIAAAGSHVTLVELPQVAAWARQRLSGGDLPVEVVDGDVVRDGGSGVPDAGCDAALVSHLLHDLPDDAAGQALRAAVRAVRPGGAVVVNGFAGDVGPEHYGRSFDVMMRLETGARARTIPELVELMVAGGLAGVRRAPFPDPSTVLVGRVP